MEAQREGKELTLFGEWLTLLRHYLQEPDWKTIARHAGIDPTTISKGTHQGSSTKRPKRSTVLALAHACQQIAQEKGLEWKREWERDLINASGWASEDQVEQSHSDLETFRRDHS